MNNARQLAERIKALPPGCLVAEIEAILEPHVYSTAELEALALVDKLDPEIRLENRNSRSVDIRVSFRGEEYAAIRLAERKIIQCLMSTVGLAISLDQALTFCHLLRDRTDQISEKQFHECLYRAIRCDRSYANNVYIQFKNNPAAFLAHRQPQTQSVELLKLILAPQ